jgi:hypothetical protein
MARRSILWLVGAGAIVGLAFFTRIFPVATFALASAFRRFSHRGGESSPGPHFREWASLASPSPSPTRSESRLLITYHPWYQDFRPSDVSVCLREARALGAGYIRSDVRWMDVLPDLTHPDQNALSWYRSYFQAARDWYGLQPMIVLSNPPKALNTASESFRLKAWRSYVETVAEHLGDLCGAYQVLNEPNNPVYRFFAKQQIPEAIRTASRVIRSRVAGSTILINLLLDFTNWETTLEDVMANAGESVDVVGFDHYPGTWSPFIEPRWPVLARLARRMRASPPESVWHSTRIAIIETGYATNVPEFRTEQAQGEYFTALTAVIRQLDSAQQSSPLPFIGIYELCDSDSSAFLDPETHFGLLTSRLSRKAAFDVVKRLVPTLAATRAEDGGRR